MPPSRYRVELTTATSSFSVIPARRLEPGAVTRHRGGHDATNPVELLGALDHPKRAHQLGCVGHAFGEKGGELRRYRAGEHDDRTGAMFERHGTPVDTEPVEMVADLAGELGGVVVAIDLPHPGGSPNRAQVEGGGEEDRLTRVAVAMKAPGSQRPTAQITELYPER